MDPIRNSIACFKNRMDASKEDLSFEVREIGGAKGKGLFALKKFNVGDVIFEEKPLICCQFFWNAAYGYLACDFCLRPLETAEENARRLTAKVDMVLPYPQCCTTKPEEHVECQSCNVKYCCTECRTLSWEQYHKTLCMGPFVGDANHPLELLQEAWKYMHFPPETSNIMLIAQLIATVKQAKDKVGAVQLLSQFCSKTENEEEEIAHKLLGDKFRGQLDHLRELLMNAVYDDKCKQWFSPDGFQSLIALVGTNGQGVGTSPISVWVKNCDSLSLSDDERQNLDQFIDKLYEDLNKESGGFLNNEGSALYSLQSSCNHSCVPNAEPSFPYNNSHLSMVAISDIEPEEEICVSYLDECVRHRSRHSRIKILRENYLFTCNCQKCLDEVDNPDVTSEDSSSSSEEDDMDN